MKIWEGDNLPILEAMPSGVVRLVITDPPFNTGEDQKSHHGSYADSFRDYKAFIMPRLLEAWRTLTPDGSIFIHLDQRSVHEVKVWMDDAVGRDKFLGEVIWAWDFGGRSKNKWPCKHNTILWYARGGLTGSWVFNGGECDRIEYMAPGLCGPEKAAQGKLPTDVWWMTIVPTQSKERVGYPSQKPLRLYERLIRVHSDPGDIVLDPFAGSGTVGIAALSLEREAWVIDSNPEAITIIKERLDSNNG